MGNEIEKDYRTTHRSVTKIFKLKILFSQNIGVLLGIGIMFGLAKYGELLAQAF